jgi:iron complex transport system ATP-binding protein
VLLQGADVGRLSRRGAARRLGLLLQEQESRFPVTVLETLLTCRYPHLGPWREPTAIDSGLARHALARVGLRGFEERDLQTLSGGERQRVAIAGLLTQDPPVMLLDEPTSHLDLAGQVQVLELLRSLADQGHAVVASLHDVNLALAYCDHLLVLHRGRALRGPTERIGRAPLLSRVYGRRLTTLKGPRGPLVVPQ